MFFIIGARGTGKSTMLLNMVQRNPKALVVTTVNRGVYNTSVSPEYLLQSIVKYGGLLDMGLRVSDFELYFEEPTMYWTTFLQILALVPKDKLKAAAYTPDNKQQSTLEQINPCLVSKVLRMSWEELPKCPKC